MPKKLVQKLCRRISFEEEALDGTILDVVRKIKALQLDGNNRAVKCAVDADFTAFCGEMGTGFPARWRFAGEIRRDKDRILGGEPLQGESIKNAVGTPGEGWFTDNLQREECCIPDGALWRW